MMVEKQKQVVIIGAGFAGLMAARRLAWKTRRSEVAVTLVSYGSPDNPQPALENAPSTLTFTPEGINGQASCNQYSGSFQFENGALTFSDIISTLMACEESIMQQETAFLGALQTASAFQIVNGQLQILYDGGVLTFNAG